MIPSEKDKHKELYSAMIRVFPLVIATMFTIRTPDEERKDDDIKFEYLLSQVLMNVINKAEIDGIAYLSRQGKDDFQYPQMVCLAIPVNDISEENEYGELVNFFSMTPPILYNEISNDSIYEKRSYINENYSEGEIDLCGEVNAQIDYNGETKFSELTPYSKFDDYLVNQEHKKFVV